MRYVMRQEFFTWGDDFTIQNEAGKAVYFVESQRFSLGAKLSFQDMRGKELAFISQKLLAWGPTYEVYSHDRLRAVVKKSLFTFFHSKFSVKVPGADDLEVTGGFSAHEYTFTRGGEVVATVSKQWFTWTDAYGVEIVEDEDDVLLLAVTVVIDMASHKKKN